MVPISGTYELHGGDGNRARPTCGCRARQIRAPAGTGVDGLFLFAALP